jgi:fumarate reductase subunit D
METYLPTDHRRPHRRAVEPRRRRGRTVLIAGAGSLVAALVAPKVVALLLGLVLLAGTVLGVLAVRSVWRMLRRPIGTLTVGDVLVGGVILRWWRRRRDGRYAHVPARSDQRRYCSPSPVDRRP